jgi:hypothetical protein
VVARKLVHLEHVDAEEGEGEVAVPYEEVKSGADVFQRTGGAGVRFAAV